MHPKGPRPDPIKAVVFDWRGTLVTELTPEDWALEALKRVRTDADPEPGHDAAVALLQQIRTAAGQPNRLQSPQGNTSYQRHRDTYFEVFEDAGLAPDLAEALFDVDSDPGYNTFAVDAADTLNALAENGYRIGILSNIHFDIRDCFKQAQLLDVIDEFVLSNEEGIQKPDPAIFRLILDRLDTPAEQTLMVGDRSNRDGVAADPGVRMPTLLVPTLSDPGHRRLHLVMNTIGANQGLRSLLPNRSLHKARRTIGRLVGTAPAMT
ncbi:HAD family hydrolase [Nocardia sp. NPDC052566]|uniref:HAD family hydrolase n=1 Tax=Nocardia sp. NPDC052566 TaxID=3364330 RepID=UPI0037C50130